MQGSSSFRLIVRRGPRPNEIYELNKGVITIGRDITNDIVINDPEVSRHHLRLTQGGGGYTIEDLGSTNGTFINGQRLTGARPLQPGETVGLGETVTLAYEGAMASMSGIDPQAATMAGGPPPQPGAGYAPQPPTGGYAQQPARSGTPPPGAYQSPGGPPQQPYGAQQAPMYDQEYQPELYEPAGMNRFFVLACGCFLVLCIVTSVIGGIIIDTKCWWDDIPVVSDMFDLGVKADATCR
jgi:hypothetical protein